MNRTPTLENKTLAMLLAGGQGERLYPLTRNRAKPSVSFGGLYRIIDFTLSNCVNSGIKKIYVLTQHKSLSLDRHIRGGWNIFSPELGEFIETVPPQQQIVSRWYAGTADAIFQNLYLLEEERPQRVLILAGDHVYRLNYRWLLDFHARHQADVTIACTDVPRKQASELGVVEVDREDRIVGFEEKPPSPKTLPEDPNRCLISMGIYVFETETLVRAVIQDAKLDTAHDFGKNVIPALVNTHRVFAFRLRRNCPPQFHYWRDIGTLDAYYEANMELLQNPPPFDLFDTDWQIRTYHAQHPPALIRNLPTLEGKAVDSIVSPGCLIEGATVLRSVLSPGVHVKAGALVEEAVVMEGATIGERAVVRKAIIDENVSVPTGVRIGFDVDEDRRRFTVTDGGVVVVPEVLS